MPAYQRFLRSRWFQAVSFAIAFAWCFWCVAPAQAQKETYPRLANYYLAWQMSDAEVTELARWDVVILDMENQVTNPDRIKKLRELNPKITILAYITSQEIRNDAAQSTSQMRRRLAEGIRPEWFFYNLAGQKFSFFPETSMLNMTPNCPTYDGRKWNKYLAEFVKNELQPSGLWDGVFYDNVWQDVTWFTKDQADSDRNGLPDQNLDEAWRAGYRFLLNETRRLVGPKFLITGNTGTGSKFYRDELQGAMFELFPQFGWPYAMSVYDFQSKGIGDRILVVNGSTVTSTRRDYRRMRYTLASTLLKDGYFSFDAGAEHDQIWWYDEYDIDLGRPSGDAEPSLPGTRPFADTTVWKRGFENGIALVNPSDKPQTIALEGDFEKISGKDDRSVNNGQVLDRVSIAPFDGLIMLKTFETVKNSVFPNGSFIRFFDINGYRARNGIFASVSGAAPGARVFVGDLTGDGTEEKVIVTGPKLEILNRDGAVIFTDYPYGVAYQGGIELSVGRLFAGKPLSIAVAPRAGGEIVVYSHIGEIVKRFFPFGTRYQGGFTVAIGSLDGGKDGNLIIGTGIGRGGEALVYANDLGKAIRRFYIIDKNYTGGIEIAAGDLNRDGKAEIVTYPSSGAARRLRIFTGAGKKLQDYPVRGVLGSTEASIGVSDVNFDGTGEIMLIGKQ